MKIAGTRTDGALLLDFGLACHILKGDAISAPSDRATLTAMGPWQPLSATLDARRLIERQIERARWAPLASFLLVDPAAREDPGYQYDPRRHYPRPTPRRPTPRPKRPRRTTTPGTTPTTPTATATKPAAPKPTRPAPDHAADADAVANDPGYSAPDRQRAGELAQWERDVKTAADAGEPQSIERVGLSKRELGKMHKVKSS